MAVHQLKTVQTLAPVHGDIWQRRDLSFKARSLYVYLSRFNGVLPRVAFVEAETGLGRDARRAGYSELIQAGLLRTRVGTWSDLPEGGAR